MSSAASQLPLPAYRNQQLFSDHYLGHLLPSRPAWRALAAGARPVRERIAAIYAAFTPSSNEAQTEHALVRPVLAALGHTFEIQAALKTPDGTKTPDYVFYRDQAALLTNKGRTLTDALPRQGGIAVGDAKYWDRPLDVTLTSKGGDPFTNKNPSYQIAFYMQHSGVDWGILTNGRLWRLYHKDSAHKLDRFYQVDLPALLAAEDDAAFLAFHGFFHRSAFEPHPLGLDALLHASQDYARGVGDSLKGQVYEALRHLAQGFLDYAPNGLRPDPATLRTIYDNALIVLYRLLFILYAEARELLPLRESPLYRDRYSLTAIKGDVARDLAQGLHLLADSDTLWPRLTRLFRIIDAGSPPLRVATFNGGLFDPARHPLLERWTVGDGHMQRAIDKLARVGGQVVDYRDLAERHLGTIYEGLLEYHLAPIAPEGAWTVALVNDKGERKATGSYYTPDYIVKYIVEQTVGPALRAAVAGQPDDAARIAAVLAVNVLDPAMGSGHFLVEALEHIARFLVELAPPAAEAGDSAAGGAREPDLAYWKRRVAQSCLYGVDLNPLAVDLAKLSLWLATVAGDRPLSFLDHHLRAGNALVGARLADLSGSGSGGEGVRGSGRKGRARARPEAAGEGGERQLSLLDTDAFRVAMSTAVDSMWLIEETAGATVAEVKEQERIYAALRETLTRRYGRLADLRTATHFGLAIDPALWASLADYATGRTIAAPAPLVQWTEAAGALADERRFFHWELEFPEVFFDRHGRPLGERAGFDAVIGNPPYIRQEMFAPYKPYFAARFASYHGVADLYLYFYEQALNLLQAGGRMAYISSGTFARANFAAGFRRWLPGVAQIETLIDFGENQPFEGAEMVRPTIAVLRKDEQTATFRGLFIADKVPSSLADALAEHGIDADPAALQQPEWTFQPADHTRLFAKLLAAGRPLLEVVDGRLYRGVLTGLNEAFVIDKTIRDRLVATNPGCAAIIKPWLRGEDLRPWYQEDAGKWFIFARRDINISRYPSLQAHLQRFRSQLEPKPKDWEEARPWSGRKPGLYEWYELQDTVDYYTEFDKAKIFWPDIAKLPRFSLDTAGTFIGNTGYFAAGAEPDLLGILQSRVLWFAIQQIGQPLRLRAGLWQYRLFTQFMGRLPIPDAPPDARAALGALALTITEQARARYALHRQARRRLLTDLGVPGGALNQKLTAWWRLDFPSLRAEIQKVFRRDIPLRERDEWEAWLAAQQAAHAARTAEIIRLETDLNARVAALFDLTPAEVALIEASTKYHYGEV